MEISRRSFARFLGSKKKKKKTRRSLEFLWARNYGGYGWFGPRDEHENSNTNVRNKRGGHGDVSWRNGTKRRNWKGINLEKKTENSRRMGNVIMILKTIGKKKKLNIFEYWWLLSRN